MNILPKSFITSSILNAAVVPTLTSSTSALLKQQNAAILQAAMQPGISAIITSKPDDIIKCVVCQDPLSANPEHYEMLAVRPAIGAPNGDFFPILETLTSTSAARVPCCIVCSSSLKDQWDDFEAKNVPIQNRVYNLQAKFSRAHFQSKALSSPRYLLQHPGLGNNGATPGIGSVVAVALDGNSRPSSSSREESSPQDEVLDLSMPSATPATTPKATGAPLSPTNLSRSSSNSSGQSKVASVVPFPSVASSPRLSGGGGPQIQLAQTRTASLEMAAAAVQSLPQFFNSSMTNLIKVTSNPVGVTSLKFPAPHTACLDNHHHSSLATSPSPIPLKKPLFCCSLCDDTCTLLVPILLRPLPNCPYFPTLSSHVKTPQIDSNGRINVCESCHRQLLQKWEEYQKLKTPINERVYKLTRSSNSNPVLKFSFHDLHASSSAASITNSVPAMVTSNTILRSSNHHIPSISLQSAAAIQAAATTKTLFSCVICSKDLLFSAAGVSVASQPNTTNAHLAFSMLTEVPSTPSESMAPGHTLLKKLIVQSAQELNLLPFLATSTSPYSSPVQAQLQMLLESGRVLACFTCFEAITSRCSTTTTPPSLSNSNSNNSESLLKTVSGRTLNGNHVVKLSSHESSAAGADITTPDLCLGCQYNKAHRLVETKENPAKDPFFPFLRDPAEANGRARVCAACHLMLETQWDAFEAAYIPFTQRNYRLPPTSATGPISSTITTTSGQSNLLFTKRPSLNFLPNSNSSIVMTNLSQASTHSNGQPTPPPLKIQISSPSIVVPAGGVAMLGNNADNGQLLLTTVNSSNSTGRTSTPPLSSAYSSAPVSSLTSGPTLSAAIDNERIFQLINDFLSKLPGPVSHQSGNCVICSEPSQPGETYQIFSASQKVLLSPELGLYPYFPMLKGLGSGPKKLKLDTSHLACVFCFHSLIAQWAVYYLSPHNEDRDPNGRVYNCRDFICYVCGVTTYRSMVRSVSIKDFPFLLEHKRPPGALSLFKGDSVVTCLHCFDTLTHQWIENERMKVPLEMRQYNWMPQPQQPPPPSTSSAQSTTSIQPGNLITSKDDTKAPHSDNLARCTTSAANIAASHLALLNHNGTQLAPANLSSYAHHGTSLLGLPSGAALTLVSKPLPGISNSVTSLPYQSMLGQGTAPSNAEGSLVSGATLLRPCTTPVVTFNPSHTLAPLVAAAMAATPVNTSKESAISTHMPSESIHVSSACSVSAGSTTAVVNSSSFAEALRHLARQQSATSPKDSSKGESPSGQAAQLITSSNHVGSLSCNLNQQQHPSSSANHSFNLSTLASVALAGSGKHASIPYNCTENGTPTTGNHAIVLNLTSLPQSADGKLLGNHHPGHPGEAKSFILTTTPEHLSENGRLVLNSGTNGNFIIQFSGGARAKETPLSAEQQTIQMPPQPQPATQHLLAVHKNVHNHSHGTHGFTAKQAHTPSNRAMARRNDATQTHVLPENCDKRPAAPAISHYDKRISKVSLEETKLRNKRQRLQLSYTRVKRLRSNSVDNYSDLSSDEEMEMRIDDEDDGESYGSLDDNLGGDSLLKFVDSILPPLQVDDNTEKLAFLEKCGLTTKKVIEEQEFSQFILRKMHRRVSHLSLQLEMLEGDVLAEERDTLARMETADILPCDERLQERPEEKALLMEALSLRPVEDATFMLKKEISWLSAIKHRHNGHKRGLFSFRPLPNNVSNNVLQKWLPMLAEKTDQEIAQYLGVFNSTEGKVANLEGGQPLKAVNGTLACLQSSAPEEGTSVSRKSKTPCESLRPSSQGSSHLNHLATTIRSAGRHRTDHSLPCLEKLVKSSKGNASSNYDNHQSAAVAASSSKHSSHPHRPQLLHHLPTSKLINSKQFAQEFHESVLQETKLKMKSKQLSISSDSTGPAQMGNGHMGQLATGHPNAQAAYNPVFFNDSQKASQAAGESASLNHSDRPAPNSAPPVPNPGTMFKFPEKIGPMQEQIRKMQQRLAQISQETQYLTERKNEIDASLHKLHDERASCQTELDLLAKCLENSIV